MELSLNTLLICEICDCSDSEENPVLEILDDNMYVEQRICLMCYTEKDNGTFS